ncbi:hypothetical protein M0805_001784 [Coniferiporia weirii]|nr:hypothetical protein M0805_001784 [Coniferiporia weirii]
MDVAELLGLDSNRRKPDIFSISELRGQIFTFADDASLARCARVCSSWSDNALDVLWRHLDTFIPLFNVLSPLEPDANGLLHFKTALRRRDWERFQKYAQRVRVFSISGDTPELASDAIAQIYQKRPTICLTPKLTELGVWTLSADVLEFSLLFIHDGLETLAVSPPVYSTSVQEFFEEMAARVPRLKDLRFLHLPQRCPETFLPKLTSSLLELETVHLIGCNLLTSSVKALSPLPRLKRIAWGHTLPHSSEEAKRVHFERTLNLDSFSTLTTLSLTAALPDIKKFIGSTPNLTSLAIRFFSLEGVRALYTLLDTISQRCHYIRELYIQAFPKSNTTLKRAEYLAFSPEPFPTVPSLSNLTMFTLFSPFLLLFNDSELVHFVSGLPAMERLYLSPHPDVIEEPVLTLDVLPGIASVCPKLRYLGLHVDCTKLESIDLNLSHAPLFESLDTLDLGYSPIGKNILPLSQLLSKLCRPSCRFDSKVPELSDGQKDAPVPSLEVVPLRKGMWGHHSEDLEEAVRLIFETRDEGKRLVMQEKDAALEEKNAALGERDAALEEKNAALAERDAALEGKDAALEEKKAALGEKDAALEEKKAALGVRDAALEEKKAALEEKKAALEERDAALEGKDAALEEKKAALGEKDAALEERKAALGERDAALEGKKGALEERDAALEEKNAALGEKDAALEEKKAALEGKDAALEEKKAALGEKKAAMGERDAVLEEKKAALVEKDAALEEKKAALVEKDAALVEKDAALAEKKAALEEKNAAMKNATSKERDAAMEKLRAAEAKIAQMKERISKLKFLADPVVA